MFKLNNWKEHIFKDDLISVLINGLVVGLLAGIIAGGLDYLFARFDIRISFGLLIIAFCTGYRTRKAYFTFHILYPVLALIFMVFGLFVSTLTYYICILGFQYGFQMLAQPGFYLYFITTPIANLLALRAGFDIKYLLLGILDVLITIWSFWYCYRLAKGNN